MQAITPSQEIVALSPDHLSLGLPGLRIKSCALTFDPPELADDRAAHRIVGHPERRGHTYPTCWWVDAEMQVLDRLADNLNLQPADRDNLAISIHSGSSLFRESDQSWLGPP